MDDRNGHTILMTTDTVGGVWSFVVALAAGLEHSGSRVVIAALGPLPDEHQKRQLADLNHVILEAFESKLEWMEDPWDSLDEAGEWLRTLAIKYRPEIVHCNHFGHVHLDYGAPVVLTMHSCVKTWWRAVKNESIPDHWTRYAELVQTAINSADEIIAPSNAILHAFKQEYSGLEEGKVIYNGINLDEYVPVEKKPYIFSMGRLWDEAKNIELLIKAARNIDFDIYIAGSGGEKDDLPKNVHLLGMQSKEQIKKWLREASVYVLPVKYEPFGLSFLEAAASGCAIIGGKIDTLKEIWQDAALYAPHEEEEELATLINILMKDTVLLEEMSSRCRNKSMNYSQDKTVRSYFELYKSLNTRLATYEY